MDHQPCDYENQKDAGVDLVLSGHTHGGQLIPLNLMGPMVSQNDQIYGMEQRENTNFIVTSGHLGLGDPVQDRMPFRVCGD